MNLNEELQQLICTHFPEHREEYRINLLSDLMMNKIRVIATNFANYAQDKPGENTSSLFNQYLEDYKRDY